MKKTQYSANNPSLLELSNHRKGISQKRQTLSSMSELAHELSDAIGMYLSENPIRSPATLGRESGVPDSTVRRMMKGAEVPDLATVIALLNVIASQEERRTFLAKHYPKSYEFFDAAFYNPDNRHNDAALYVSNEVSLNILRMCANRQDTTELAIRRLFGDYGIEKLAELMEVDYIVKDEDGNLRCTLKNHKEIASSLEEVAMMTRIFNRKNLNTDAAIIMTLSESLSAEGIEKLYKIGMEYLKKLHKIVREHPGNIPVYMGLIQNTYDSDLYIKLSTKRNMAKPKKLSNKN